MKKIKIAVIFYLLNFVPFSAFFCYNLGKYETYNETFKGTLNVFLPLFPLLLIVTYITIKYYRKKQLHR